MFKGVDAAVVAMSLVAAVFEVLMPLALALWARRRLGVAWKVVGWGALTFALSQLLTRLPMVQVLGLVLTPALKDSQVLETLWLLFLCLTAGLFEETARLWVFGRPLKDFRRWRDAVGLGVGHGGLESALLVAGMTVMGLFAMATLAHMDPATLSLPPDKLDAVVKAKQSFAELRWWSPLLGAYERVGALVAQIALSLLVLQRYVRGSLRWYWLAVAAHFVFNLAAVLVAKQWGAVASEGVVTGFALVGLAVILRLRREEAARQDSGQAQSPDVPSGVAS
ncbi:YhfC family intramembrane metalloprotease [Myxococcus landrumensis]|uniref:YhfC family intramembrane metalloprotease n=1 Tax=Myxococcus landrumensis TaxID=2813577 RepID=A0ABX7N6X6_9BACT|nr:YhfC family glutamic-type intramembrane protease [Myxococcus landrumus]QSQ13294.1 YhfC family intramembrane metalloprotease [Myxococcus landrumus]